VRSLTQYGHRVLHRQRGDAPRAPGSSKSRRHTRRFLGQKAGEGVRHIKWKVKGEGGGRWVEKFGSGF
jgi:hypothetical protein